MQQIPTTRRVFAGRLAAVCLMFAFFPLSASADAEADARKIIQKSYDAWNAAAQRKDVAGMKAYHAPDYVMIGRDGKKQSLKELVPQAKTLFAQIDRIEGTTSIESFQLSGDTATVEYTDHNKIYVRKRDGTLGLTALQQSGRDFWTRKNGKWLRQRTRILDATADANGGRVVQ